MANAQRLSHAELLQLKRWNTPTIYNGWEQITRRDRTRDAINLEETRDFMPQMGPMIGYAVTVVVEPSNAEHRAAKFTRHQGVSRVRRGRSRSQDRRRSGPRQAGGDRLLLG